MLGETCGARDSEPKFAFAGAELAEFELRAVSSKCVRFGARLTTEF